MAGALRSVGSSSLRLNTECLRRRHKVGSSDHNPSEHFQAVEVLPPVCVSDIKQVIKMTSGCARSRPSSLPVLEQSEINPLLGFPSHQQRHSSQLFIPSLELEAAL